MSPITVSGISSGGFMAAQMHVAFSSMIDGAGIVAAGPYGCATGNAAWALTSCMQATPLSPDGLHLRQRAELLAANHLIDDLSNLHNDRVFLMSGLLDETVSRQVVEANRDFYQLAEENLKLVDDVAVGHAFATLDFGNDCSTGNEAPWLSDCDYDLAGEILHHLLGQLVPRAEVDTQALYRFIQPNLSSLDRYGYAYIPEACWHAQACRVHLAFHGCGQSAEKIGEVFVRESGYNAWAQSNRVIVIYPQVHQQRMINPHGCWDWWGYTSAVYASKLGPQMQALKMIIDGFVESTVDILPHR